MKIRRFVAADMKTALAQIKEELGADAVIMSNKKVVEGVEIMAAIDYYPSQAKESIAPEASVTNNNPQDLSNDVVSLSGRSATKTQHVEESVDIGAAPVDSLSALLNRKVQQEAQAESHDNSSREKTSSSNDIELQFKNFTDRLQHSTQQRNAEQNIEQSNTSSMPSLQKDAAIVNDETNDTDVFNDPSVTSFSHDNSNEFETMKKEMHTIRHLLEHQLSGLMWQDMAQKNPQKALLINKLVALGLTDHMADQIAGFIPPQQNEQDAWEQAKKFIAQQLNTTNNDIIHHGGVISLVGPTGVGKTTTIAKLAARFAQIHGADEVVLISTDSFRIGGFEQLTTYGRIIGCQVKLANDAQALDSLLQQFGQKKLILIDTAGMGQRDMRLAQHLTDLIANARVRIRNYLVLSANTQQRVMQENVERFKKIPLAGCIYTKLDESISIGEIISTAIQNGLPIGYLTDGQRVPEDIKVANAEKLVALADKMSSRINHQHTSTWRPMPKKEASAA
ncbi:flagellar biosynthesis protein FlhF [Colwellia sp. RE-S-Sl-9]